MGRTTSRNLRVYVDGYSFGDQIISVGSVGVTYNTKPTGALEDAIASVLPDAPSAQMGDFLAFLHTKTTNPASAMHTRFKTPAARTIMLPIGFGGAPAMGNPIYFGAFEQLDYILRPEPGFVLAGMKFGGGNSPSNTVAQLYDLAWGVLLLPKSDKTVAAINTAIGFDSGLLSGSAFGGVMCYQLFAANGTVNLKVQHADTNVDNQFSDLIATGLISGVTPTAGFAMTATKTTTVKRYVRWQVTWGTATTATFAIAFARARW